MHMFFSALVTGTSPPPPQTTNNVGRVHAEFRGSTLYNVGVGGGGWETARYCPKISTVL